MTGTSLTETGEAFRDAGDQHVEPQKAGWLGRGRCSILAFHLELVLRRGGDISHCSITISFRIADRRRFGRAIPAGSTADCQQDSACPTAQNAQR
jgi:hypothetical protein